MNRRTSRSRLWWAGALAFLACAHVTAQDIDPVADAGRTLGRVDAALDQLRPESALDRQRRRESKQFVNQSSAWAAALAEDSDDDGTNNGDGNSHNQADPSIMTAARRFHQWDGRHTAELRPFLPCIHDEKRRGLVESVIDAFGEQLQHQNFRWGINHGDFNDANIMVDDHFAVSGVIDFGDSVER